MEKAIDDIVTEISAGGIPRHQIIRGSAQTIIRIASENYDEDLLERTLQMATGIILYANWLERWNKDK